MTTTSYLELDDQATGANNNTWGDVLDANMAIIEQAIARVTGISTTGGTTTLTSSQNRYPILRVTGVLASNAVIEVKTQEKNWIFINATTGSYTVTVKTSAGTGKTLPRGRAVKLYCDGTNVEQARAPGIPAAQAGGTADAITATFEPATTSGELQDGTLWIVEAGGANTTTTPTFNPDSTGALTIKKNGGQALAAGDIRAAGHKLLLCYDSSGGHVELLNPTPTVAPSAASDTVSGLVELATTTETLTGTDTTRAVTPDALASLWEQGSDVASATTTSLGEGGYFNITGTTTITDIDLATDKAGRKVWVKFAGALTLTHSSTLILPTAANITTAAGDTACFVSEGSDTVRCLSYNRASGAVLSDSSGMTLLATVATTSGTSQSATSLVLTSYKRLYIVLEAVSNTTGSYIRIAGLQFTAAIAAGSSCSGGLDVDLASGALNAITVESGAGVTNNVLASGITTATTTITFTLGSGAFDAGSIKIYGVK